MYCTEVQPTESPSWRFSLTLDQKPAALFCSAFFASLATAMGEGMDSAQLGVEKVTTSPLKLDMWCVEGARFVSGSCVKGLTAFFADLETKGSDPGGAKLA